MKEADDTSRGTLECEWVKSSNGFQKELAKGQKTVLCFLIISLYKLLWLKPGLEGRMLNKPFASEIYLYGLTTHPLKQFSQKFSKYDHYNQHEN